MAYSTPFSKTFTATRADAGVPAPQTYTKSVQVGGFQQPQQAEQKLPSASDLYSAFTKQFAQPKPIAAPRSVVPPAIVAPVARAGAPITPAVVQVPQGDYQALQDAFYHSAYDPVSRDLAIQRAQEMERAKGDLANAGLADSGVGATTLQKIGSQYAERDLAASEQAAQQAASARYQAEITISSQNAEYAQQAGIQNAQNALQLSLANAGFSLEAQKANASNILQGKIADTQAYLTTMGINADQASRWRDDFLKFFGESTQAAVEMFNGYLQGRKLTFDINNAAAQNALEQRKIDLQRQLGLAQIASERDRTRMQVEAQLADATAKEYGTYAASTLLGSYRPEIAKAGAAATRGVFGF